MNLTQLNERLDQIQSEIWRFQNGRAPQLLAEVDAIRQRVAAFIGAPVIPPPGEAPASTGIVPFYELERAAILNAVRVCGDKERAAKALGIGKTTIYRKLAEYAKAAE